MLEPNAAQSTAPVSGAPATMLPAAQAQATPPAADPAVDYATLYAGLEKRASALASENGRLKAQVSKLPDAASFIEAWDNSEQAKADLIAKGITEDVLAELTPRALKAMHKSLVGAPTSASTLQADIAAAKAAAPAEKVRSTDGMGMAPSGGAPAPSQKTWADAQRITKPLGTAEYFDLLAKAR